MNVWNWVLIIGGALLILLEVALGGFAGFDLVLIGSAFVLGGGIGLFTGSATTGFIVASVLCIVYIALGRKWVRKHIRAGNTASNTDALVGRPAIVTQRVARHTAGQVRVNDEVWRAETAPGVESSFEPGAEVTVAAISGVTLQVR